MRIYRILSKFEYKKFLEKQNISHYSQQEYRPSGMLFPENIDRYGKFFFFELEDVYNFVHHFSNATSDDAILELEIDRETALKYLAISDYYYFDPTKSSLKLTSEEIENIPAHRRCVLVFNHAILELFLDHDIVNKKIRNGEYRIIPGNSILEYDHQPNAYYEGNRNPMTVMLAQKLKKVRKIRQDISMIEYNFRNIPDRFIKILNEEIKPKLSERQDIERLKVLNEKLGDAIADVKVFFKDFAREHERYMTLVPVEERQPE